MVLEFHAHGKLPYLHTHGYGGRGPSNGKGGAAEVLAGGHRGYPLYPREEVAPSTWARVAQAKAWGRVYDRTLRGQAGPGKASPAQAKRPSQAKP